jgi:hypothetical protein
MKNLIIDKTKKNPQVEFLEDGNLKMEGKAYGEDPKKFFEPLLSWCRNLSSQNMSLEVKLNYLNTSATKYMFDIIRTIDANNQITKKEIKWFFDEDDEEILELGQIIEESTYSTNFFFHQSLDL